MKEFCKFTTRSPAASYIPLPRFLFQDEALRDITNDEQNLVLWVGTKRLIKRRALETYIDRTYSG